MTTPSVNADQIKSVVNQLLGKKTADDFATAFDVCQFLKSVVDKVLQTTNNTKLTLQEKEDFMVSIAGTVVDFLEEKGILKVEVAQKTRSMIKTVDIFLDVMLGIHTMLSGKSSSMAGLCSFLSCLSTKTVVTEIPKPSPKVEEIRDESSKNPQNQAVPEAIEGNSISGALST